MNARISKPTPKTEKAFDFALRSGGSVKVWGMNFKHALKRFQAMTGNTVPFIPLNAPKTRKAA